MSEYLIILIACALTLLFIIKNRAKSKARIAHFALQPGQSQQRQLMRSYRREQSCIARIIFFFTATWACYFFGLESYKTIIAALFLLNYLVKFYFVRKERFIYLQYNHLYKN